MKIKNKKTGALISVPEHLQEDVKKIIAIGGDPMTILQSENLSVAKEGGWIQKAVNPKHKGYCTPMSKKTCTPRRKAFAKTMKKHHGFHEEGGYLPIAGEGDEIGETSTKKPNNDAGYSNYFPLIKPQFIGGSKYLNRALGYATQLGKDVGAFVTLAKNKFKTPIDFSNNYFVDPLLLQYSYPVAVGYYQGGGEAPYHQYPGGNPMVVVDISRYGAPLENVEPQFSSLPTISLSPTISSLPTIWSLPTKSNLEILGEPNLQKFPKADLSGDIKREKQERKSALQGIALGAKMLSDTVGVGMNATKDILTIQGNKNLANEYNRLMAEYTRQARVPSSVESATTPQTFQGENFLAANGTEVRQFGGDGRANVIIEDKEVAIAPNGYSKRFFGDKHSDPSGGIYMSAEPGTKILSEKLGLKSKDLLELKEYVDKLPQAQNGINVEQSNQEVLPKFDFLKLITIPKKGNKKLSYSDMANKFKTDKNFKLLNDKFADPIQKSTAQMLIDKKNQLQNQIFALQEINKKSGVHGQEVQQNALQEDIRVLVNNQLPKAQEGVFTGINPNVDWKTLRLQESERKRRNNFLPFKPNELPEGYGSQLGLEAVFRDFEDTYGVKLPIGTNEQKLQALREYQNKLTPDLTKHYKLNFARGNEALYNEFKKSKGYKKAEDDITESQNFYDWAKNSGKITDDYVNKGLWGHEYYNVAPLKFESQEEYDKWKQDPDWKKVGDYYVDQSADPNQPITYYYVKKPSTKKEKEVQAPDPMRAKSSSFFGKIKRGEVIPMNIGIGMPLIPQIDVLAPIDYYKIEPNLVEAPVIQPYTYDIDRAMRSIITNATDLSGSGIANRLQAYSTGIAQKGERYDAAAKQNALAKYQANVQNARAKDEINRINQIAYADFVDKKLRALGALGTQQGLREEAEKEYMAKAAKEANTLAAIQQAYFPGKYIQGSLNDILYTTPGREYDEKDKKKVKNKNKKIK